MAQNNTANNPVAAAAERDFIRIPLW